MSVKSGMSAVWEFLEKNGPRDDGLTAEKFLTRAEEIEDPDYPDCVVFEIERHRAILGTVYRRGEPMGSFQTYWARYAFDPKTETLNELPEKRPRIAQVDWDKAIERDFNDFSFSFCPVGEGKHRLTGDGITLGEWVVSSFEEVERHIQDLADGMDFEATAERMVAEAGTGDEFEICERLRESFCEKAVSQTRREWEEYLKNPEANSEED